MIGANMEIKVSFLAGTSIEDAVSQAIQLLHTLPMLAYVKFNFNGISVSVNSRSKVGDDLEGRLGMVFQRKDKHWIV